MTESADASGGRFYVKSTPETRGEASDQGAEPEVVGVEGSFYRDPAGGGDNPVEQASAMAAGPPSKEEIRDARREDKRADKSGDYEVTDPAAETQQEEPVAAASDTAGDPPVETTDPPARNASREEWINYAVHQHGASVGEFDGVSRNAIRDRYLARK